MPKRVPEDPAAQYLSEIQHNLSSGIAREQTYRPALKDLIESLDSSIDAFNDPKHIEVGAPDFTIRRKGHATDFPVGWIETKDVGEDLDKTEKSEQLKRYFGLHNLILTDYLEFRWYVDGKPRLDARLASLSGGKRLRREPEGERQLLVLLHEFLAYSLATLYTPQDLAQRMAKLAHLIRDLLLRALETGPASGRLHNQFDAFRETLIPDLKPDQFSDMYAQTIAYGLFAARCQTLASSRDFSRAAAADLIPRTNPFLRRLFREIAFELDPRVQPFVDDLVALLRHAEIGKIMEDFGKRTAREDPVVHFYEDFLQEYDPKVREMRGVYYTPEPVVSYIVRSVDHLLKTKFNKPLGLADKDVLILDPACGTGTFLYFVIRHIYDALVAKGQKGQWNSYVSENLLKRVFGFELLMAPYAVAHLKLGLLLQELGYKFESDERLGIYLTNTLEEAIKRSEAIFAQWIAEEANAAAEIKRDRPIMVVLGNPPYSNFGRLNRGEWILELLQDYKKGLQEKKLNLDDDFIKFIRFGQWRIDRTGHGILAFITNNTYLDGITHRRMRQSLMESFTSIYVQNLHGLVGVNSPDGSQDRNVFDIQQGVAISLFSKESGQNGRQVSYSELWGGREHKYKALYETEVQSSTWTLLKPTPPQLFFVPREDAFKAEYELCWSIKDIFPKYNSALQTKRDSLTIHFTQAELVRVLDDMRKLDAETLRTKYALGPDGRDWAVPWAKRDVEESPGRIVRIHHKPFDFRFSYFTARSKGFLAYPRADVTGDLLLPNVAIATVRQLSGVADLCEVLITEHQMTDRAMYSKHGTPYVFPLWVYPEEGQSAKQSSQIALIGRSPSQRHANLSPTFLAELLKSLDFNFSDSPGDGLPKTVGAEDILAYVYGILHSPTYRQRYGQFLKADFPRVPLTRSKNLFLALVKKGLDLSSLHLMKSPKLNSPITRYEEPGDHIVDKVSYAEANPKIGIKSGRVYINRWQFFEGVPKEVWEFHIGGYQVCEKWLKDRKDRKLSSDDIDHYQKIIVAISETIRIMKEIDDLIPGWPLP